MAIGMRVVRSGTSVSSGPNGVLTNRLHPPVACCSYHVVLAAVVRGAKTRSPNTTHIRNWDCLAHLGGMKNTDLHPPKRSEEERAKTSDRSQILRMLSSIGWYMYEEFAYIVYHLPGGCYHDTFSFLIQILTILRKLNYHEHI